MIRCRSWYLQCDLTIVGRMQSFETACHGLFDWNIGVLSSLSC